MKKTFTLLILFCAPLFAQNYKTGSITGTTCFGIDTTNAGTVGISVQNSTGSAWSGTIQPSASIGGDPSANIQVTPAGSSTAQSTITANGVYYAAISGVTYVQVCGNTVTNTAAIKLFPAQYSKNFGIGSAVGLLTGCTGIPCATFSVTGIITASGFDTSNLNGGFAAALGNGSQVGFAVGNGGWYGDSTLVCLHNVVNFLDQGCELSSELNVPSIDRSIGITTSAMGAQSSATLTPITNMSWNLVASKNYAGWCEIPVTFAASATIAFGLVGPGTPTSYNIDAYGLIGAAAVYGDISLQGQVTWVSTKTAASGAPGAVTEVVHVNFQVQNGTTAGALTLDTAANGTNTITVGANTTCHVMQLN